MDGYHIEAKRIVARHTAHRSNKQEAKKIGKIASVGTERSFRQCIANYLKWCHENGIHPDFRGNLLTLTQYLEERREWVQQKTLNQERQALQLIYQQQLPYLLSFHESVNDKRSYVISQVNQIIAHQTEKNVITTWLAFFAGIRAHEGATILPVSERNSSPHRKWDLRRFLGLQSHQIYSVVGKGGLVREVAVPTWLAHRLEARRRQPVEVVDREIFYVSNYDIGFGQAWSQSFTSASKKALGFSKGGHGLRHSYSKWRLQELLEQLDVDKHPNDESTVEEQALLILSQELGHFRLDIVYTYLR